MIVDMLAGVGALTVVSFALGGAWCAAVVAGRWFRFRFEQAATREEV